MRCFVKLQSVLLYVYTFTVDSCPYIPLFMSSPQLIHAWIQFGYH